MDKYYLCRIYGNGDIDAPEPWIPTTGAYRPAIEDVKDVDGVTFLPWKAIVGQDPLTGDILHEWAVVVGRGDDHSVVNGNPDILLVSTGRGEETIGSLPDKARVKKIFRDAGVRDSDVRDTVAVRNALDKLIKAHQPGLDFSRLRFRK